MTYAARILLDSVSPAGVRVTTMEWTYPRFIHAEIMTYRMFSRNTSSSRAIPVRTMIRNVLHNPAGPVYYGKNQRGMQARIEVQGWKRWAGIQVWYGLRYVAIMAALLLVWLDWHKQIANRLLEPWMWITAIITTNEPAYRHCFRQRCHADAQPEFRHVAMMAHDALNASFPVERTLHAPLMTDADYDELTEAALIGPEQFAVIWHVSTARCARVSYLTHDGRRAISADLRLYDQLRSADPPHTSPFEHVLTASEDPERRSGNVVGWIQHREIVELPA